uniref:Uncharacterized protein n=1 Tax=Ditylenchus dipsaci TaxID=166011 RepID=A0A915ETV8_9BILA
MGALVARLKAAPPKEEKKACLGDVLRSPSTGTNFLLVEHIKQDRNDAYRQKRELRIAFGSSLPSSLWMTFENMIRKVDSIAVSCDVPYAFFGSLIDEVKF